MILLIIAMEQLRSKSGRFTSTNAQFTLGKELNSINTRISSFEERLTQLENRYYKQFTAMEKAINQANSQSASLSSFFAN